MQRISIVLAILITMTVLLVACGGGGEGPTPTVAAEQAEPINILIKADGIEPNRVEIEAGKTYKFVVTNTHETGRRAFRASRWRIEEPVPPGATVESEPFSEDVPGEYITMERTFGGKPAYQCMVVVK